MIQKRLGSILVAYGLFLVLAGVVGFEITKETSRSSLFNGTIFGTLVVILGFLHRQGRMWTHPASLSASAIFTLTFVWRAIVQWLDVTSGDVTRVNIAALLSLMAVVSAVVTAILFRHYRH